MSPTDAAKIVKALNDIAELMKVQQIPNVVPITKHLGEISESMQALQASVEKLCVETSQIKAEIQRQII